MRRLKLPQEDKNIVQRSFTSLLKAAQRTFRLPRTANTESLFPQSAGFWVSILTVFAIVIFLIVFADDDLLVYKRQADEGYPNWATPFIYITEFGRSGWVLVSAAIIGLVLSVTRWTSIPRAKMWRRIQIYADMNFIFFTVAISGVCVWFLKNMIGRARPKFLEELGANYFNPAAFQSEFASFPSGHATTFGSFFMVLALIYPRLWPVWLSCGIIGALSRVVVGAHYLSDAIMGATLGAGFALLAARWLAQRNTMFVFNGSWKPDRKR